MQQCKFFLTKFVWLLLFSCCCLLYCSIKEAIKRSVFHEQIFSHEATFSFVGITYYVSKTWQNQSSKTRSAFQGLPTLIQRKCVIISAPRRETDFKKCRGVGSKLKLGGHRLSRHFFIQKGHPQVNSFSAKQRNSCMSLKI